MFTWIRLSHVGTLTWVVQMNVFSSDSAYEILLTLVTSSWELEGHTIFSITLSPHDNLDKQFKRVCWFGECLFGCIGWDHCYVTIDFVNYSIRKCFRPNPSRLSWIMRFTVLVDLQTDMAVLRIMTSLLRCMRFYSNIYPRVTKK